ncbi:MAG: hypothetical protein ACOCVY_02470 [Patescibacteria group bacterium]
MSEEINNENKEIIKKGVSPIGWEDLTKEEEESVSDKEGNVSAGQAASKGPKKKKRKETKPLDKEILTKNMPHPIWLRISECAKLGGVQPKTIRRALKSGKLKYMVEGNRYFVDLKALILYLMSTKKLQNKLKKQGIGQYVEKWKK